MVADLFIVSITLINYVILIGLSMRSAAVIWLPQLNCLNDSGQLRSFIRSLRVTYSSHFRLKHRYLLPFSLCPLALYFMAIIPLH